LREIAEPPSLYCPENDRTNGEPGWIVKLAFATHQTTARPRLIRCEACWFEPTRPGQSADRFCRAFVIVNIRRPMCVAPHRDVSILLSVDPDYSGRGLRAPSSTLSGACCSRAECWFKPTPDDEQPRRRLLHVGEVIRCNATLVPGKC